MSGTQEQPTPPFPEQAQKPPGLEHRIEPRPQFEAKEYRPAGKLRGLVALITGGDSGIGRAVAVLYAREGARVAFTAMPEERSDAEETINAVEEQGAEAICIYGDVRDPEFCRRTVAETVDRFERLDILVNNAAYQQHKASLEEISEEEWSKTMRTNIDGYFLMAKAALPHLKPGSSIINTGSIVGLRGSPGLIDYGTSKGAIYAFTKSLALNLVDRGIRVNCVAPGPVWTPLNPSDRPPEEVARFGEGTPMGRPAQPEEIAPSYVFFASNADSSYISGEVLTLLGGATRTG